MYGPIPPGSEWHSPVSTPYDPDEANRILDRAGYPRNENGIRFTVEIDYEPSAQFSLSILKYLQSQFIRTIGVYSGYARRKTRVHGRTASQAARST